MKWLPYCQIRTVPGYSNRRLPFPMAAMIAARLQWSITLQLFALRLPSQESGRSQSSPGVSSLPAYQLKLGLVNNNYEYWPAEQGRAEHTVQPERRKVKGVRFDIFINSTHAPPPACSPRWNAHRRVRGVVHEPHQSRLMPREVCPRVSSLAVRFGPTAYSGAPCGWPSKRSVTAATASSWQVCGWGQTVASSAFLSQAIGSVESARLWLTDRRQDYL